MQWPTRYLTPNLSLWQGRSDIPQASCFFQIIKPLDLAKEIPNIDNQLAFALIGFRCDEGIRRNLGRTGAVDGPVAIREMLAKLPVQRQNVLIFDAGDILCTDKDLEQAQIALGEVVALLLEKNIIPLILGGGHELAWGHYQGIAKKFPHEQLGIINFDAHFDMRPLLPNDKGSSGTPFLQIANAHAQANNRLDYNCVGIQVAGNTQQLFETAKKFDAQFILADHLQLGYMDKCVNFIDRIIDQNQIIYLTLCLDVFAAPYAPGVSAPQPLGVTPWQIMPLVRQLADSGKVISYDVAEMCPQYDIDQRTAKLAATFIYEIIHHHHRRTGKFNGYHISPR